MFDDILSKIKDIASDVVSSHTDVPQEHKEGIANQAMESISEEINKVVGGGNFAALSGLVSGKENVGDNEHVKNIIGSLAAKLQQQFHIGAGQAGNISRSIIPAIFEKAKEQFADFDFKSLLSHLNLSDMMKLMGSGGSGLLGKVKSFFGK